MFSRKVCVCAQVHKHLVPIDFSVITAFPPAPFSGNVTLPSRMILLPLLETLSSEPRLAFRAPFQSLCLKHSFSEILTLCPSSPHTSKKHLQHPNNTLPSLSPKLPPELSHPPMVPIRTPKKLTERPPVDLPCRQFSLQVFTEE